MQTLEFKSVEPPTLGIEPFYNTSNFTTIVPNGSKEAYEKVGGFKNLTTPEEEEKKKKEFEAKAVVYSKKLIEDGVTRLDNQYDLGYYMLQGMGNQVRVCGSTESGLSSMYVYFNKVDSTIWYNEEVKGSGVEIPPITSVTIASTASTNNLINWNDQISDELDKTESLSFEADGTTFNVVTFYNEDRFDEAIHNFTDSMRSLRYLYFAVNKDIGFIPQDIKDREDFNIL